MSPSPCLVWFHRDLRLSDHPALREAAAARRPVIPVFIWSPEEEGRWRPGKASRAYLLGSLKQLEKDLQAAGSRLVIRKGPSKKTLGELIEEIQAGAVYWNRRYEPALAERDEKIRTTLEGQGIEVRTFNASLLFEPEEIQTGSGGPYRVFTPFWKTCRAKPEPSEPLPRVRKIPSPDRWPRSLKLNELTLETGKEKPGIPALAPLRVGEKAAAKRLKAFLDRAISNYAEGRDRPDWDGVSRLSTALHFGEISPRQVWHAVKSWITTASNRLAKESANGFLRQLGWREFAHHLLFHYPHTPARPLRAEYEKFAWRDDPAALRAWQEGRTGYPIVDAGMRQLRETGWMHNRVRMIVGSFLVKDLLIAWQQGAEWFWATLIDADLANNTLGWQWVAGCGADAAPFFRVFNPVLQGRKFDPEGEYVRRYVPELKKLSTPHIHAPWKAPAKVLSDAGIELGKNYPAPVVDHAAARIRALRAYERLGSAERNPIQL